MADIATFSSRESVVNATLRELEKKGINITLPSLQNASLPDSEEHGVFGVPLGSNQRCCTVQCGARSVSVPKFLADTVGLLEGYLTVEGLFRKAGSLTRQREIKAHIQAGGSLATNHKPHDVACLLKLYLRELPDPLLTTCLAPAFAKVHTFVHKQQVACIMLLCLLLPQTHLSCLQVLCQFLHKVSNNSEQNLMDTVNLALVMAPNLLPFTAPTTKGGHEQCLEASTSVVKILIEHYGQIGLVPEEIASVARRLEEEGGSDHRLKSVYTIRSCETPDGLVTDGSTGDELDSDGDVSTGIIRKKSSKKSRTRMFVHNLGNKLRSRYSSKNVDTKPILNSSPATKEHATRGFSNLDNHDESAASSPLITIKRKADYDPHLMSASKRQAILQQSVGTSKLRSGKLFRTPLNMKATKRSILRRCRHTDYGKTRKNAYLVLQPSHSIDSFVDHDQNCDQNVNAPGPSTCTNTEMSRPRKTIPLSKSEDDFPLVEFTMSVSVQEGANKPSTPVCIEQPSNTETATNNDGPIAGKPCNFMTSRSVPCKPLKSSISADNVKYFSATPEINFIKIGDNHEQSNPYVFEAKSTHYPRSVSAHQGLKSAYQFGSNCNLLTSHVDSSSTLGHSKELQGENESTDTQNAFKFTHVDSSLKKSTSHPDICDFADTQKNGTGNSTHHPRDFKSSSLSPSKITGNTGSIGKGTKPRKNDGMKFAFSEPAVVQPVAAYILEVDSPHQYSDIEKDPECSEIYSMDEVQVNYMESQDVRKQLFVDVENDHSEAFSNPKEVDVSNSKEVDGDNKDNELFSIPLKNLPEANTLKSSGLLEEINSDLAQKHRYSPNYVIPLTGVQSTEYDDDVILDYTKSPHHCVATSRVVVNDTKQQDDSQRSQLEFLAQRSPDPWAVRRQTQNFSNRAHIYEVTKEDDTSRCTNSDKADSSEQPPFSQVITSEATSTTCDSQCSTFTTISSVTVSPTICSTGTQMASVTTSAASIDNYSATLPSSYRQKSNSIHRSTNSSIVIPNNGPKYLTESGFCTLRNKRHSFKTSHVDTKPPSVGINLSTVTTRPKPSTSAGISKSTSMPKFYKEMVPLSRKALNNSDNVRTKIQQFEGITTKREKYDSNYKACGLTSIAGEVRELESSPQHCSKVRRSGTWNFHSPALLQKQSSVQGGGAGGTRKSNGHTQFTFQCPKVKSEVVHRMMGDHNSHHQKTASTNENTTGGDREETTRGIVGKKRSSPSSQTENYKVSRPLHYYNAVTSSHSLSATQLHKVAPTLSLPKGKENNDQQVTEKTCDQDNKQESVPTARTIILREWII